MKEETKIKRIQALSEGLDLINLNDYTKKYFEKDKRGNAKYHFEKESVITIQGSKFIIDKKPNI